MQKLAILTLTALLICGCSSKQNPYGSNGTYGMMNNEREFGTVVSLNTKGGSEIRNGGATATAGGASFFSGLTASTIFSPVTGLFSTNANQAAANSPPTENSTISLHYVVRKDNGQEITIDQDPEVNEQIVYPGQRVVIQSNGEYVRLYPVDVEDSLGHHVPGAPRYSNN